MAGGDIRFSGLRTESGVTFADLDLAAWCKRDGGYLIEHDLLTVDEDNPRSALRAGVELSAAEDSPVAPAEQQPYSCRNNPIRRT